MMLGRWGLRSGWLLALSLSACTQASSLSVQLQTDLVPGTEIDRVEVALFDAEGTARGTRELDLTTARGLGRPVRIAEFAELTPGTFEVRATLLRNGSPVQTRPARTRVAGPTFITLLMVRDCNGVTCPGAADDATATACLGGRCVPPECTEEHPDVCGPRGCADDSSCPPGGVSCVVPRCSSSGVCFSAADDTVCAPAATCDAVLGCVTSEIDAGPRDGGGLDGGAIDDTGVPIDTGSAVDAAPGTDSGVMAPSCASTPGLSFVADCGGASPSGDDSDGDGLSDLTDPDPDDCNALVDLFDASELPGPPWSDPTRVDCPWADGDVTTAPSDILGLIGGGVIIRARFTIDSLVMNGNAGLSITADGATLWCTVGRFLGSQQHVGPGHSTGGSFAATSFPVESASVVVQITRRAASPGSIRCEAFDDLELLDSGIASSGLGTSAASTVGFGVHAASATLSYVAVLRTVL